MKAFKDLLNYLKVFFTSSISVYHIYNVSSFSFIRVATNKLSKISSAKQVNTPLTKDELLEGCRLGLDSHADISCASRHVRINEIFHGQTCNVTPFNDSYSPMQNIHTANVSYAADTAEGQTYIVNVNQSLDFTSSMNHSLLCVNQARMNNVTVDDIPPSLDPTGRSTHSIYFKDEDVRLPLSLHGSISYLPVRFPSDEEMDQCLHLDLTSDDGEWDPMMVQNLESGVNNVSSIRVQFEDMIEDEYCYGNAVRNLLSNVHINSLTHSTKMELTPDILSENWCISLPDAKRTLQATTQNSVSIRRGNIHKRVKTLPHHSRYKHLTGYLGMFCSDTFK